MTYEAVCNDAEWHAKHSGNYVWVIKGGELDGTYYQSHFPNLIDEYDGEVVLWHWTDGERVRGR